MLFRRLTDRQFIWGLVIVMLILAFIIIRAVPAEAQNFGQSLEHQGGYITFQHESELDSAWAVFSYPDAGNFYDSVKLLPSADLSDDGTVVGASTDLDSIGIHSVRVIYWEAGTSPGDTSGIDVGIWLHDYSSWFLGMLGGYMPGSGSREIEGTEYDRLVILFGSDSTLETRFFHPGGPAGRDPDSSRADEKGDW